MLITDPGAGLSVTHDAETRARLSIYRMLVAGRGLNAFYFVDPAVSITI